MRQLVPLKGLPMTKVSHNHWADFLFFFLFLVQKHILLDIIQILDFLICD